MGSPQWGRVQERGAGPKPWLGRPQGEVRAPHPPPSLLLQAPKPRQLAPPCCLRERGYQTPDREGRLGDPEPSGASGLVSSHNTPERAPSTQPAPRPFSFSWAGSSEQMGSGEADPLPQPRGCSKWRVVSGEGGEPRPCKGRLLAPQTHVVGLKKLLGSEALAGVRPALAPGRGRADAEAVSSAPLASSPEGPQDSRRTRGTLTQQESGASPGGGQAGLGPGADSGKSCYRRTVGPCRRPPQAGEVVRGLGWGPGGHRQVLSLPSAFLG